MAGNNGVTTSSSLDSGDTKSQSSFMLPQSKPAGLEEVDSDSLEDDTPDDDGLDVQQQPQLQHNLASTGLRHPLLAAPDPVPGSLQAEWSSQEQLRLVEILSRYPADKHTALERYLHAAAALPNKSTRDVAHRVHSLQQLSLDGRNRAPTAEELRIRAAQQSVVAVTASRQPSLPTPFSRLAINRPPTPPIIPLNIRRLPTSVLPALPPGGLLPAARLNALPAPLVPGSTPRLSDPTLSASALGGVSPETADVAAAISTALDSNYVLLQSIKENMIAFNVSDNTDLLVRFRDNLLIAQLHLNSATGVLGSMPQLPVSINLDLAARFLPAASNSTGMRAMSGQLPIPPSLHPPPLLSPPLTLPIQPPPPIPSPALDVHTLMSSSVPTSMPVHMPVPSFAHAGSAPTGMLAAGLAGISMPGAPMPMLSHSFPYTMPGAFSGLAGLPLPMPTSTIPTLPVGFPSMENFFSAALSATGAAPVGGLSSFPSPFGFPLGMTMPMMPQAAALAMQARLMMAQGLGGLSSLGMLQSTSDIAASTALAQQQGIPVSDSLRAQQQLQSQALLQHAALQQQHLALQQLPRPLPSHLSMSPQLLHHQQQQLQQLQQQQQPHVALQASWMANPSGGAPLPVFAAPQMLNAGLMLPIPPQAVPHMVHPANKVEIVPVPPSTMPVPLSSIGMLAPKATPLVGVKQEASG